MVVDMRTPLSKVRGLGSAKEGTDHFWHQRLTSVANIPLLIFFAWLVISLVGAPYAQVVARLSSPVIAAGLVLTLISVLYHMYLGLQVVIEDYVHGELAKILLIMANSFFTFAVGALAILSVLKLTFGG